MIDYSGDITGKLTGKREIWRNDQLGWVSIPKNANMQFRTIMTKLNAPRTEIKSFNDLPAVTFCVWRDPVTRLISGIGEFSARRKKIFNLTHQQYTDYMQQLLRDPTVFDEHLEPQVVYTSGIKYDYVVRFDNLLSDLLKIPEMQHHEQMITKYLTPERTRRTKHSSLSISEVAEKNTLLINKLIEKYYQKDREIYNNPGLILK